MKKRMKNETRNETRNETKTQSRAKRKNRAKSLMLSAVLLASVWNPGVQREARAAELNPQSPALSQSAQWTDPAQYKAAITMTVSGLSGYRTEEAPGAELSGGSEETCENIYEEAYEETNEEVYEESPEPDISEEESADGFAEAEEEWAEDVLSEEELDEGIPGAAREEENPTEPPTEIPEITETPTDPPEVTETPPEDPIEPEEPKQLFLISYISEYFQPDMELMPREIQTEPVNVRNQKGEEITITKAVCSIDLTHFTEELLSVTIPVILREEYRTNDKNLTLPVCQDEPLEKDCPGTGSFLLEKRGEESITAAQALSPMLEVQAAKADFRMELKTDAEGLKAGQSFSYELKVRNTGARDLSDIMIESSFCMENIKAVWEQSEGVRVNGKNARIERLPVGEETTLHMTVQLTEEQSGTLAHTVHAETLLSEESVFAEAELTETVEIRELKADFTVEKTADHTEAYPGDKVSYQICIRNTGERTLHSVVSTERFLTAGVQARFVSQEGVSLNADRTQALLAKLEPGQAAALRAEVVIPQFMEDKELLNQVTVRTQETGERAVESQSKIQFRAGVTPTPYTGAQSWYQSGGSYKSAGSETYQPLSKPKTGDDTETGLLAALLILSVCSGAGAVWQKRRNKR